MNFRLRPDRSVVLMGRRSNAPYRDRIEDDGRVLIYEGHDVAKTSGTPGAKSADQPRLTPSGRLTQNGLFERAALIAKAGRATPELVAVYEKIHAGRLELDASELNLEFASDVELETTQIIPSTVKLEVWKRDDGKCVLCGAADNLHYDHDVPYSKGGSSLTARNIRLLCARHNLAKSDKIE
jgi:hypothetical protein